jgi:predicted SprT family Zn-dependent metalloprotease
MEIEAARGLALGLMRQHRLTGWRLVFDNAKMRAGICRAEPREIGLSRVLTLLHTEAEVRDTILHEMAHALVGPEHGHDAVWRARALRIGSSARRCVSATAPRPEGPWVGTCPSGHRTTRHRQPVRVQSCGQCAPRFDPGLLLEWTWKGRVVRMHPSYEDERRGLTQRYPVGWAGGSAAVAARNTQAPPPAISEPVRPVLAVGARVRVNGRGKYAGSVGRIVTVGRTRYHVKTRSGLLTAPFALVELC